MAITKKSKSTAQPKRRRIKGTTSVITEKILDMVLTGMAPSARINFITGLIEGLPEGERKTITGKLGVKAKLPAQVRNALKKVL